MAYVKNIRPVKKYLYKILKYITNPEKTDYGTLITGIGGSSIEPKLAFQQMRMTKTLYKKIDRIQGHHFVQSFAPGEVSPELAHQIGKEWIEDLLGGEFEGIISTHVDEGHIHNHIVINSVNFKTGYKFYSTTEQLNSFREKSDEICQKYGLSIINERYQKDQNKKSYNKENFSSKKEYENKKTTQKDINDKRKSGRMTYRNEIKDDIDATIFLCKNYDEFIQQMHAQGYTTNHGQNKKHITFRKNNGEVVRGKTLGAEYTDESIKHRIQKQQEYAQYENNLGAEKVLTIKNFMVNKELSTDTKLAIKIPGQEQYFYYPKSETLYVNFKEYKVVLKPSERYPVVDQEGNRTAPLSDQDLSKIFDAEKERLEKSAAEKQAKKEQKAKQKETYQNQSGKRYSTKSQTYEPFKKYVVKNNKAAFARSRRYNKYLIPKPFRNYRIYAYRRPTERNSLLLMLVKYLIERNYNKKILQMEKENTPEKLKVAENRAKVLTNNINNIKKMLELIEKNNIQSVHDIPIKISAADKKIEANNISIKAIEGKIVEKKAILKLTEDYIKLKPEYMKYKSTGIATKESEKFKTIYKALMNFDIKTEQFIVTFRRQYDNVIEDLQNDIIDIEAINRKLKKEKNSLIELEKEIKEKASDRKKINEETFREFRD